MRITFLGTGSALTTSRRTNTSLLLQTSDARSLLIDCSGTPSLAISRANAGALATVRAVVLSHAHVDHVYGLPSLVHNIWLQSLPAGGASLELLGPAEALKTALALVDAFGLRSKPNAVDIESIEIPPEGADLPVDVVGIRMEAFPVEHVGMSAFGFVLLPTPVDRLVFSADSEVCANIESRIAPGTVLVHDCGSGTVPKRGHAAASEVARLVARTKPKSVLLTHISDLPESEEREICRIVAGDTGVPVGIPSDGDAIAIG